MKKTKIIGLIVLIVLITITIIQIAKIVYQTPVFTGRISNSVSGRPVKDAVVTAVWWKSSSDGMMPLYSVSSVTGEKGEYKIPKHTRIHGSKLYLPNPYYYMSLGVMHPLYTEIDLKANLVWEEKNSQTGKMNYYGEKLPNGSIKLNMALDGLKERFLLNFGSGEMNKNEADRMIKTWDPDGFLDHLEKYVNGWYWNTLKEQNISFDISETFEKWEGIARGIDNINNSGRGQETGGISYSEKVYKKRIEILTNLKLGK